MSISSRAAGAFRFLKMYWQHIPLFFPAVFDFRCRVLQIEGALRGDSTGLSITYAGRDRNLPYLLKTIFESYRITGEERTSIFGCRRKVDRWLDDVDLLIVDIGWPYASRINRGGKFLDVPDWVSMGVDLGADWEATARNFRRDARKNDLRRIRRNRYRYETTSSKTDMEHFYDDIYVPYMDFIHDADSIIAPRRHVVRQGCKGTLLKVLKGSEVVCAGIVLPADDVLVSLWMGIPKGLHDSRPEACISALYVFFLQYALDNGFKAVDFAGTRAFLNDGALRFKKKWGAVIEDTFSPGAVLIRPQPGKAGALEFCHRMPVIARSDYGLDAVVFIPPESDDLSQLDPAINQYGIGGLDRLIFVSVDDEKPETTVLGFRDDVPVIRCRIRASDLPTVYCRRWLDALDVELPAPKANADDAASDCDDFVSVAKKETE